MTTLLQTAQERARLFSQAAPMPSGADSAALNIIILAGGSNARLVADIVQKRATDTIVQDSSSTLLRGQDGSLRVPPGLVGVGGQGHALAFMINHLYNVHQCCPVTDSLHLVCSPLDAQEYSGVAGFFDDVGRFPRDWQAARVLPVGCGADDVADLKAALAAVAARNGRDVLVISANAFLWPTFGLQKLVSNMVVSGQNTIALQRLTDADVELYGTHDHTMAVPSSSGQVPALSALAPNATLQSGDYVAQDIAYLRADSFNRVAESRATTLRGLFVELSRTQQVFGALMPWGYFDMGRLVVHKYVNQLLMYRLSTMKAASRSAQRAATQTDNIEKALQEGDDSGLGKSTAVDHGRLAAFLAEQEDDAIADFDRHFFSLEKSKFRGYQLPAYKLPQDFYMSSYRRQAAGATV